MNGDFQLNTTKRTSGPNQSYRLSAPSVLGLSTGKTKVRYKLWPDMLRLQDREQTAQSSHCPW